MKFNLFFIIYVLLILFFAFILYKDIVNYYTFIKDNTTYYVYANKKPKLNKAYYYFLQSATAFIFILISFIINSLSDAFYIIGFTYSFIFLLYKHLNVFINDKYIIKGFKIIKKSDIDYFNLNYKENIITIYLKNNKPIVLTSDFDLTYYVKLFNDLGYGNLLTKKIYNFN